MTHGSPARPTVVVLGGGYAGIQVARPLDALRRAPLPFESRRL